MDTYQITQIIVMAALIFCSGFFSATETAFSSLNRTKIKSMAEKGDKRAELTLSMVDQYDKLLSTTLVGNNVVNISLSSIATIFFIDLVGSQDKGASLATIVITIIVLIFGEISPKSMAKESPEKFSMSVAPILNVLMILLTPINFLFTQWKKLLSLVIKADPDRRLTQDELLTLVDEVEHEGGIDKEESDLLKSAIEFTDREAEDILTPRVDLTGIERQMSKQEISQVFAETGYSRLPVYDESIDNIVGILHQKDFYIDGRISSKAIEDIMKPPIYVTPVMKISDLLKMLQRTKSHIAVVTDEYGGTMGIVTMEDILEELVGEIWDEHDEIVEDIRETDEENCYIVTGSADPEKVFKLFDLRDETDASTVNGWLIEETGALPKVGDCFYVKDVMVKILKADHKRILEAQFSAAVPTEDGENLV